MSVHTSWGPSSAKRRILCPGSLAAEEQHPDTDNLSAVIGSGAHELADRILSQSEFNDLEFSALDYIGEQVFVKMSSGLDKPKEFNDDQVQTVPNGYMVTVDSEMSHAIQGYVEYCRAFINDKDFNDYFKVEQSLDLSAYLPGNKGTADVVTLVGTTLHVIDLKYGKGVQVFAEENAQGRCYAIGAMEELEDKHIVDVVIHIYQPRLNHIDTEEIEAWDLQNWAEDVLVPAYRKSIELDAPRIPGDEQCTFCKHRAICPELRDVVETGIREGFPILDKADKKPLPDIIPLQVAKLAQTWAKAVEAHAIERLEAGEEVNDGEQSYKLVHGRSSRSWKDEQQAQRKLRMNKVFSKDFMVEPKFKSVAQIEKVVGKKAFKAFDDLVDVNQGKPTIAPESDKRSAINSAEALGFEDVT